VRKRTVMNVKPDCMDQPEALQDLSNLIVGIKGLCIVYRISTFRSEDFWREFYVEQAMDSNFPDFNGFVKWRASKPTVELIIEGGEDVVKVVREQVLVHLRERYTTSDRANGFHASSSDEAAEREVRLISRSFWE
jgi:nucleoside diphosphate kinase